MARLFLLPSLALVASCTAAAPAPSGNAARAGEVDCIDLSRVASRRPLGPDAIRFELTGGRAFVNHLPGSCPGLERSRDFGALAFEVNGNRLCRGDIVRAVDPAIGGYGQSVPCVLGRFAPAPPEERR